MDRNKYVVQCRKTLGVALRKESVDRNGFGAKLVHSFLSSLSVRRAWIEMNINGPMKKGQVVALRKESVDRNLPKPFLSDLPMAVALRKESVDRNCLCLSFTRTVFVALRKESVDRNSVAHPGCDIVSSRSP